MGKASSCWAGACSPPDRTVQADIRRPWQASGLPEGSRTHLIPKSTLLQLQHITSWHPRLSHVHKKDCVNVTWWMCWSVLLVLGKKTTDACNFRKRFICTHSLRDSIWCSADSMAETSWQKSVVEQSGSLMTIGKQSTREEARELCPPQTCCRTCASQCATSRHEPQGQISHRLNASTVQSPPEVSSSGQLTVETHWWHN